MLSSSDCKVLVPLLDWNTLECIELCARSFPFEGEKLHICTSVHLFCVFGGAFYFPCPMSTSFTLPMSVWLVSWVLDNCWYYSFGVFAQPNSRDTVAFCVFLSPLQGSVAFGNDTFIYLFLRSNIRTQWPQMEGMGTNEICKGQRSDQGWESVRQIDQTVS